jgi:hypothetical protein
MTHVTRPPVSAPLVPIEQRLQRLGYIVVPHGTDLCVRLPLLCSVRLREESGRIRFIPKFGPFGRSSGLLVTAAASTAIVTAAAAAFGIGPVTVAVAFAGIAALATDACRFVVTEGCLTRLQNLLDRADRANEVEYDR